MLWAELHPEITEFGRVDVSDAAAESYGIKPVTGLPLCLPIRYSFDGVIAHYLPDLAARLTDGRLLLGEAGVLERKSSPEERAAFDAAREYLGPDGEFVLLLKDTLTRRWFLRARWLHLWRFAYFGPEQLVADITDAWTSPTSASDLARKFKGAGSQPLVRHAVMKALGDAMAQGRWAFDLNRGNFDVHTVTRLSPSDPPATTPPPLLRDVPAEMDDGREEAEMAPSARHVDETRLEPAAAERLASWKEGLIQVEAGMPAARVAPSLGVTDTRVRQVYQQWREAGRADSVLLDGRSFRSQSSNLAEAVKRFIRRAYKRNPRLLAREIRADEALRRLCDEVGVALPRTPRIAHYLSILSGEVPGANAPTTSRNRFILADARGSRSMLEGRPGYVVGFDEERSNLFAQLLPGHPATDRVHKGKVIDVATSAVCGLVASCRPLDQFDVRRVLVRTALPKDDLVRRAGCENDWPIALWPMVLEVDNAYLLTKPKMIVSELPRSGVWLEFTPAQRPPSKPVTESSFARDQKVHEDYQPNSAKRHPALRGRDDPARYAAERGISVDDVESDFIRTAVDADLHSWYSRDGFRPISLYKAGVAKYWVRTYEGDVGELMRRMKRPIGVRTVSGDLRISFDNRDYTMTWVGDADTDPRNELPYRAPRARFLRFGAKVYCRVDDDDVRTLDVYDEKGLLLGVVVCNRPEMLAGPVSKASLKLRSLALRHERTVGVNARERAQAAIRRRNAERPKHRVAKSAARVEMIERRAIERHAPKPGASRPKRARRTQRPAFAPSSTRYRTPTVRMPERTVDRS